MASNVTATLTCTLLDGSGAAVGSANVKAQRVDPQTLQATTMATADTASATSNSSTGVVSLSLTVSDTVPVTHKITFPDGQYAYVRFPANAKAVGLGIVQVGTTPAKSVRDITAQFPHLRFIGQDIASAATIVPTCHVHNVTGTTAITTITGTNFPVGGTLTLITNSTATITDGSNIKAAGNLVGTADDTWTAVWDGTNWYETGRSVN